MKLAKRLHDRKAAIRAERELRERIEKLREEVTRITPRYGAGGSGGSGEDKMMAYVARIDKLERELTSAARRAYQLSMRALDAVDRLPDREREVIILRDFYNYSWHVIEKETGIPKTTAIRIREQALGYTKKRRQKSFGSGD